VEVRLADGTFARIEAIPLPAHFDMYIQSWDMAFKDLATSVVGQVWGVHKADRYLLDQRRARLDMPGTKEAVKELTKKWARTGAILVEDKANGPAVIQELKHDISGLIELTPEGGKMARAHAAAPQVESGNLYLPHPSISSWVGDFIDECAAFPNGRHDDQVDAMTQALNWLRNRICRFSVPESQITIDEMEIPDAWPRGFGMAITKYSVAALWGARDPSGTIYLYGEHLFLDTEPGRNAKAIAEWGPWIPGVLNLSALQGSQEDKIQIAGLYRKLGLEVAWSRAEGDAGTYKLAELLARNKLKVFAPLAQFLGEYRGADEQSPLLLCCQSLVLSIDRMRTKPAPRPVYVPRLPSGERSWMGYGG
jgi:predicted phage terminase large subunit-like protein